MNVRNIEKTIDKIKEQPLIRIFSIISIIFFCIWLIMLIFDKSNIQAQMFYAPEGKSCANLFSDFIDPINWVKDNLSDVYKESSDKMWKCYSPGTFVIFRIFSLIANGINSINIQSQYIIASIFMTITTCLTALFITSHLKTSKKADKILFCIAFLTSSIFIYSYERANIIMLAVLLSSYFIFNYDSKNKVIKELALLSLALAFMLKVTPGIFGLLLLYKKDYKSALRAAIYGLIFLVIPAFAYSQGLNSLIIFKENANLFYQHLLVYVKENIDFYFNLISVTDGSIYNYFTENSKIVVYIFRLIISVILFCSFFYKEVWRKVFVLVLSMIFYTLPMVYNPYIYLYFLPVIMMYFNETKRNEIDYKYVICFLILFLQIKFVINGEDYSIKIRTLVLYFMLANEMIYGIKYFCKNHCIEIIKSKAKFLTKL